MKKALVVILAAGLSAFALSGTALALHDGGVARCEACHTMHNSVNNAAVKTTATMSQFNAGPFLLKGSDQSSACLACHEGATRSGYKVSTSGITDTSAPPQQLTPGGDFSWLKKNFAWTDKSAKTSAGQTHGHNIVAADFGYTAETRMAGNVSPGGNYPVGSFYCSSCHDPHGKYRVDSTGAVATTGAPIIASGSYASELTPPAGEAVGAYRLLGGTGYKPKSITDATLAFANTIPTAVAPDTYNASEATTQVRVAYGSGMSEWCSNCHGQLHNDSYPSPLRHPSGNAADLTATIIGNYNSYVYTGKTDGTVATAYNSLVPFETGLSYADRTALAALTAATTGAETGANVMCLSCHRAHATGFDSMTRWDTKATLITDAGAYVAYTGTAPRTLADIQAAYYDRAPTAFSAYQRSLCNKCHVKD